VKVHLQTVSRRSQVSRAGDHDGGPAASADGGGGARITGGRGAAATRVSVAPMMDKSDRDFRYLARLFSPHTLLYTEMVSPRAVLYGDRDVLLGFEQVERPLALQLGGDDADELKAATRIAADYGYDEINLNIGCPSDRVQEGRFGACLMARPRHVADLVAEMRSVTNLPVTVKHRIGIDGLEQYQDLVRFVETVVPSGPAKLTVHARIAILKGLSPKENRSVPPLRYHDVYRLKREFPKEFIELNGGVGTIAAVHTHLAEVDAVMIGRAAYDTPKLLAEVEREVFDSAFVAPTRGEIVERMLAYIERRQAAGRPPHTVFRHMLGLFACLPGSRAWKRALSGGIAKDVDVKAVLHRALAGVPREVLDQRVASKG